MTGVFCNQCGHQNPAGSNFCSSCGAVLEHGGEDESTSTTITFVPLEAAGEVADEEFSVTIDELPEVMLIERPRPARPRAREIGRAHV